MEEHIRNILSTNHSAKDIWHVRLLFAMQSLWYLGIYTLLCSYTYIFYPEMLISDCYSAVEKNVCWTHTECELIKIYI